jgi:hypothetical protein
MNSLRKLLFIISGLLFFLFSFSQQGIIRGYIKDELSHTPLVDAVINIDNNKIESSDNFGMFSIKNLPDGKYEVLISHIGYASEIITAEVEKNKPVFLNINLKPSALNLSTVTVSAKKNSSLNTIAAVDMKLRPVNTSQDLLRMVPGLFIAQHAGGGKAEQIFLRGYDLDHGTDISITADGIPVNMVSHAHGQGYADLHFLIPETIEKLNFDKGPYFAYKGNFATTGFAELQTKDFLQSNFVQEELAGFNAQRIVGMFKLLNKETEKNREQLYIASEYFKSDGYFDAPQNFHRFNIMTKYSLISNNNMRFSILASSFSSKWNASGQIPERAVESDLISKFGSIDNSEGGNTRRSTLSAKFTKHWKNDWQTDQQIYFVNYRFNLYSDFSFFLKDSINGDEINQKEKRNVYGYTAVLSKNYFLGNKNANTDFGWGFRFDNIGNNELNHARKRIFLEHLQQGSIHENNEFAYISQYIAINKKFNINAGLRYDFFSFAYKNVLVGQTSLSTQIRGTFSPKLNFNYIPNATIKVYLSTGIGFHSNDSRVILDKTADKILPKVFGTDLGVMIKPSKNLFIKTAFWQLYSQQEFVYAGDDGIVVPGGRTKRIGVDVSVRYQFSSWLYSDMDVNYSKPRAVDSVKGKNFVPLAPGLTSVGGLTVKTKKGFNGSFRYRYIGNRPANETYSLTAVGYFLLDAVLSYKWKNTELKVSVENILNSYWKEAQFATESRLRGEATSVTEINYTPGTPRFLKFGISFNF